MFRCQLENQVPFSFEFFGRDDCLSYRFYCRFFVDYQLHLRVETFNAPCCQFFVDFALSKFMFEHVSKHRLTCRFDISLVYRNE